VDEKLPLFDCYIAPCIVACPIHQDIPEYISLVGQKRYSEAMKVIYENNALPAITGEICAHQCMYKCTRLDYEGTVEIREMKKIAVENGYRDFRKGWTKPASARDANVAIVGAGPAGLSAAYFLSREGFKVTVFDRHDSAGGVVEHVVPRFRIPREAIRNDIEFIEAHGVEFVFGVSSAFSISDLKKKGFDYICVAIGAEAVREFKLEGDNTSIIPSWDFLNRFNQEPEGVPLGERVVVVGAGDTAMDAARASLRTKGVKEVRVVYRRSEAEVPASREEYELCLEDKIPFHFLRNPERFDSDGTLTLRVMELGEPDESGRRRPVPTDKTETMKVDTVIPSIGETADAIALQSAGLVVDNRGRTATDENLQTSDENVFLLGDSRTGPSTIVECIGEGRKAADAICRAEDPAWTRGASFDHLEGVGLDAPIMEKKGILKNPIDPRSNYDTADFGTTEAIRCLECNYICNKCVDVCPNRANVALKIGDGNGFKDRYQIVHLDAFCNECGDCGTFCPYDGRPYIDKLTVFNMPEDFENSENPGFYLSGSTVKLRVDGKVYDLSIDEKGELGGEVPSVPAFEDVKKVIAAIKEDYSYLLGPVLE
jgi:putative selenate reductase